MLHSKGFMRSGTVVGSFKIDLKTVYDAPGIWLISFFQLTYVYTYIFYCLFVHIYTECDWFEIVTLRQDFINIILRIKIHPLLLPQWQFQWNTKIFVLFTTQPILFYFYCLSLFIYISSMSECIYLILYWQKCYHYLFHN